MPETISKLNTYVWYIGVGYNPAKAWACADSEQKARQMILTNLQNQINLEEITYNYRMRLPTEDSRRRIMKLRQKQFAEDHFMCFHGPYTYIKDCEGEYESKDTVDPEIVEELNGPPDIVFPAVPMSGFSIALDG